MARILTDQPVTFADACKVIPTRPHINTVRRWAFEGINGVKLRHFKCGNRPCTTHRDIEDFLSAINPGYQPEQKQIVSSAHDLAEQKLDALGV